jgi:D-xylose transport system substrate-binding protein
MFYSGYISVLSGSENRKNIKIIAETWVEDWRREGAFDFVSKILKENPGSVQGIIAANDSLAWGAIDAVSVARLTGKIKVTGHDADLAACQRIVEGTQLSTVYKPIKNLVEETLKVCRLLLQKEPIPYQTTISDGTYDVPYVMIDVISVNKDNIDETVIKDGFHLKEDVYRETKD